MSSGDGVERRTRRVWRFVRGASDHTRPTRVSDKGAPYSCIFTHPATCSDKAPIFCGSAWRRSCAASHSFVLAPALRSRGAAICDLADPLPPADYNFYFNPRQVGLVRRAAALRVLRAARGRLGRERARAGARIRFRRVVMMTARAARGRLADARRERACAAARIRLRRVVMRRTAAA